MLGDPVFKETHFQSSDVVEDDTERKNENIKFT